MRRLPILAGKGSHPAGRRPASVEPAPAAAAAGDPKSGSRAPRSPLRVYAPRPLSGEQDATLARAIVGPGAARTRPAPWLRLLVILLRDTGLRIGEALALRVGDVDLRPEQLSLRVAVSKNGRGRTVPVLTDRLRLSLARHLRGVVADQPFPSEGIYRRQLTIAATVYVFPGRRPGTHLTQRAARLAWRELLRRAGLPLLTLHQLRHSYATELAARGASPWQLAAACGWRKIESATRYTAPAELRRTVGPLGR